MRILIATPFFPYPPENDLSKDIFERIKLLKQFGHAIHILYTDDNPAKDDDIRALKQHVNHVCYVKRERSLIDFLSPVPFKLKSRKKLMTFDFQTSMDILFIEGDCALPMLSNKSLKVKTVVKRIHECEFEYFKTHYKNSETFAQKLYYFTESKKFINYRDKQEDRVDLYWLSKDENLKDLKIKDHQSVHVFPHLNKDEKINGFDPEVEMLRELLFLTKGIISKGITL